MAHSETQFFLLGKTLRVKAEIVKAHAHELEPPADGYTHQRIVGIEAVHYDANVGSGDADWQLLEKGVDVGGLFKEIEALKNQLKGQKMYNGKLKKRLQSMGVLVEEEENNG